LLIFGVRFLLLCGLLAGMSADAQEFPFPLSDFTAVVPPRSYTPDWYLLNHSAFELKVAMVDGELRITRKHYDPALSPAVTFSLPGGDSLMGVNMGEFGGGLYYKPRDSTHAAFFVNGMRGPSAKTFFRGLMIPPSNPLNQRLKGYLLVANANVQGIFEYKDSLFYLDGLAHMGLVIGGLYSLEVREDSFTIHRVADLKDCPLAYLVDGPRLWIATLKSLLLVENGQVEKVFDDLFWDGVYPNSMCKGMNGELYIGLRSGYARVDVGLHQLTYYKYNKDPATQDVGTHP
jgi:hypothetical protein